MRIRFELNGQAAIWEVGAGETLLEALRRHEITSVKYGCDTASCGTCTVLLDGKPVPSCAVPAGRVDGHAVLTVEGVPEEARRLGEAMAREGADQCGFCGPGLVMSVVAMRRELEDPDDEAINVYLAGNLCRCSGYTSQTRAIRSYLEGTS
ncbi:2Fe-2S iron-sulfur cluster binding domain-containing protein [bacterium]|nr:2Fe-2S iron-sulfur cluster binding domain-containing protein [bacterium]MBU1071797.1 2Fe-2S iron-sulfur cluster binding domain-containing protein [bacterium]MBU1674400.1 2Fe-2S iron-sulfur cluster binding domain-containing protein [bacterium]